MITKETLDQLEKETDELLEKTTPEELMSWLMNHRAKEYIRNSPNQTTYSVEDVIFFVGHFATQQLLKAKREWALQEVSDFGQLQTALEELEKCKQKNIYE